MLDLKPFIRTILPLTVTRADIETNGNPIQDPPLTVGDSQSMPTILQKPLSSKLQIPMAHVNAAISIVIYRINKLNPIPVFGFNLVRYR